MSESDKKIVKNTLKAHSRILDTNMLRKKISFRNAFGMYHQGSIRMSHNII